MYVYNAHSYVFNVWTQVLAQCVTQALHIGYWKIKLASATVHNITIYPMGLALTVPQIVCSV
jgi:hypothetical protein